MHNIATMDLLTILDSSFGACRGTMEQGNQNPAKITID
jgi:hypothetical protein